MTDMRPATVVDTFGQSTRPLTLYVKISGEIVFPVLDKTDWDGIRTYLGSATFRSIADKVHLVSVVNGEVRP